MNSRGAMRLRRKLIARSNTASSNTKEQTTIGTSNGPPANSISHKLVVGIASVALSTTGGPATCWAAADVENISADSRINPRRIRCPAMKVFRSHRRQTAEVFALSKAYFRILQRLVFPHPDPHHVEGPGEGTPTALPT